MANKKPCVHWWLIEEPAGRDWFPGRCRKCGEERLYQTEPGIEKAPTMYPNPDRSYPRRYAQGREASS